MADEIIDDIKEEKKVEENRCPMCGRTFDEEHPRCHRCGKCSECCTCGEV